MRELKRTRLNVDANMLRIRDCLRILGIEPTRRIFSDYTDEMWWDLLEQAAASYQCHRVSLHPDRGGDAARFHALTAAWKQLRRLLKNRGYELESENMRRPALASSSPFRMRASSDKDTRKPLPALTPEPTMQMEFLAMAAEVDREWAGNYGQDKNAITMLRLLKQNDVKFPDAAAFPDKHSKILRVLQFFGASNQIKARLGRTIRRQTEDLRDIS